MSRPLPDPVLFLDHSFGTHEVAGAPRAEGSRVEVLIDHSASETRDEDGLTSVGNRGWAVLTKDQRIRRRHVEITALRAADVTAFVLTAGDLTGAEMAEAFVRALPRIKKTLRDHEPPFVAGVDANETVKVPTDATRRASKRN